MSFGRDSPRSVGVVGIEDEGATGAVDPPMSLHAHINPTLGYSWGELLRRLKAAGFVEHRRGKGSHRQFVHPERKTVITVSVHTKKEVGTGLAQRILKEAGL